MLYATYIVIRPHDGPKNHAFPMYTTLYLVLITMLPCNHNYWACDGPYVWAGPGRSENCNGPGRDFKKNDGPGLAGPGIFENVMVWAGPQPIL